MAPRQPLEAAAELAKGEVAVEQVVLEAAELAKVEVVVEQVVLEAAVEAVVALAAKATEEVVVVVGAVVGVAVADGLL